MDYDCWEGSPIDKTPTNVIFESVFSKKTPKNYDAIMLLGFIHSERAVTVLTQPYFLSNMWVDLSRSVS